MAWNSGLQIRIKEGRDQGRVIPLDAAELTLGRALDSRESAPGEILFHEPTVSRVHAILRWDATRSQYQLLHRSRTNPTLVDERPVEEAHLQAGQRVRMGMLVFEIEAVELRTGRLGDAVQAPSSPPRPSLAGPVLEALGSLTATEAEPAPSRTTRSRSRARKPSAPGGLRLVAAQGPDQGTNFPLKGSVLVVGRSRGEKDERRRAGVLLADDSLPLEQALLVWQEREFTYGILQSEGSRVHTRIRRVIGGTPQDVPVRADVATPLYEGDVIVMGATSLVLRRAEEESQEEATPTPAPRPVTLAPSPSQEETLEGRALRLSRGLRRGLLPGHPQADLTPGAEPPSWRSESMEATKSPPAAAPHEPRTVPPSGPRIRSRASGRASGGASLPPPPPRTEPTPPTATPTPEEAPVTPAPEPAEAPLLYQPGAAGNLTNPWRYRSDFILGFLEGPRKGQKISLLASELPEDRELSVGSPGARVNDIEVEEPGIANDQATLRYRAGRFTLTNHRGRAEVSVNLLRLGEGEQVTLMTGDKIQLGHTRILFIERRVVELLRQYRLELLEGVGADHGKVFDLNREQLTIGRGRNADIRLADLEVSRIHCLLFHRDGQFYVQHRSDTNPTFVNGVSMLPGAERLLVPEDRIQLSGHSVIAFRRR